MPFGPLASRFDSTSDGDDEDEDEDEDDDEDEDEFDDDEDTVDVPDWSPVVVYAAVCGCSFLFGF